MVDAGKKREKAETAERYGLRGLVVKSRATIKLSEPAVVADLIVGNLGDQGYSESGGAEVMEVS